MFDFDVAAELESAVSELNEGTEKALRQMKEEREKKEEREREDAKSKWSIQFDGDEKVKWLDVEKVLKTKDEVELMRGLMEERKAWISLRKVGDNAEDYKKVFYWHVLDTALCTEIAAKCPTSIDELREKVSMAEEKISEYGEEIVYFVKNFIAT